MKIKQGVSLIVLVITIIVMVILAGAIVLTLNNSGIIAKAEDAVEETNLATVREVVQMAWAEAYVDGARSQSELEQAVKAALTESKITDDMYKGYTLQVTENGVEFVETVQGETGDIGDDSGALGTAIICGRTITVPSDGVTFEEIYRNEEYHIKCPRGCSTRMPIVHIFEDYDKVYNRVDCGCEVDLYGFIVDGSTGEFPSPDEKVYPGTSYISEYLWEE